MSDITHKEIYERLVTLETKVDRIDTNTSGMVTAFQAASGAFTVLEFIAKLAKPVLWIIGVGAAIAALWDSFKTR
jgi:hypothetical protein